MMSPALASSYVDGSVCTTLGSIPLLLANSTRQHPERVHCILNVRLHLPHRPSALVQRVLWEKSARASCFSRSKASATCRRCWLRAARCSLSLSHTAYCRATLTTAWRASISGSRRAWAFLLKARTERYMRSLEYEYPSDMFMFFCCSFCCTYC